MKKSTAKKLFTSLPIIGLVLGAVAIATELHRPTPIDQPPIKPIPTCQTVSTTGETPVLCAE